MHSPPLLILDEPTVGVDPLLRQSIWRHLVTLAQTEKITVVITTHYIEEARQANVVGLMRQGKLLAEDSPEALMSAHGMDSLEEVFLKLCITDSSREAARLAGMTTHLTNPNEAAATSSGDQKLMDWTGNNKQQQQTTCLSLKQEQKLRRRKENNNKKANNNNNKELRPGGGGVLLDANGLAIVQSSQHSDRVIEATKKNKTRQQIPSIFVMSDTTTGTHSGTHSSTNTNNELKQQVSQTTTNLSDIKQNNNTNNKSRICPQGNTNEQADSDDVMAQQQNDNNDDNNYESSFVVNKHNLQSMLPGSKYALEKLSIATWFKSLWAVIWKNYIRLKRNPPVLIFEFILPAVQVILFCLCIGGDPFDVPLAVVNDELIPQASRFFLDAIDKKAIRQIPFNNLSDAIASVRRGETWGAIHIPDRYTHYLQERLLHPAEINNETIANGTINIYPDLTNLHLALAMENTFREAFIKFARDTLHMFGYDPEVAELPVRVEAPIYGTLKRNGYLEFMAPGVVISITYVMATGLTALAFILEKRDGLLERSLVSGVTTSQILLAHASVQVLVMIIQIGLVLTFTFFVFEIPSNGPFLWVVLLILLQGCTGMGFGLLVSAVCEEENTAVMMLVGTFYTNLILAGIIWPLEAMPRWLRWFSYVQPQTLPTETLRNILSRGWGIGETGVYIGFAVTIGWLIVFLVAAGLFMRYTK